MNISSTLESMDSLVLSGSQRMADALQRAASTGDTIDFLHAQAEVAAFTNGVGLYSASLKTMHDMVAGIIQKI